MPSCASRQMSSEIQVTVAHLLAYRRLAAPFAGRQVRSQTLFEGLGGDRVELKDLSVAHVRTVTERLVTVSGSNNGASRISTKE